MSTKINESDDVEASSSSSSTTRIDDWRQSQDLDFLYAARLIKDARESRNITFKKSILHLKYKNFLLIIICSFALLLI